MDGLDWLDRALVGDATEALFRCCGCAGWASAMAAARPFGTVANLLDVGERAWAKATREDVLEAFSHHPRIGDRESLRARFPATHAWSGAEQGRLAEADDTVLDELASANREYEARFGHIFIVCASGKTAGEMLALLRGRLGHTPEVELKVAADEQMKITRLRLERLLQEKGSGGSA